MIPALVEAERNTRNAAVQTNSESSRMPLTVLTDRGFNFNKSCS
jgi:hypothetical protein